MSIRFPLSLLVLLILNLQDPLRAQDNTPSLLGRVEGDSYVSATGAFRVKIPVLSELGGAIFDTDNVVTFQDNFTTHQSIACFEMDGTQRREEETRGHKEYLIWFFTNFVQADFQQRYPGASIESAHFLPNLQSGTLLTYNLLPGGSMFANKVVVMGDRTPPIAKRGNLVFVQNGFVYVVSIELAEKVLERSAYNKTVAEEDALLRKRLLDFFGKITFTASPPKPAAVDQSPASALPVGTPAK